MRLEHTSEDAAVVTEQLGRAPRGQWAAAKRCHLGVPMVIESAPVLADGSPFPTLFWLTCPILVKRASRLEAAGDMATLSERLRDDSSLRARLIDSIARYRARREAHARLDEDAMPGGGPDRIKCLHAHVAHELADPPNPVGAAALVRTGWPDCREPCVEVVE